MAEYTSTREGFEKSMKWSMTGSAEDARHYAETTVMPNFTQVLNDKQNSFEDYIKDIAEWRGKVSDYEPTVHEFLRDGDQLAARMTGTIKVQGAGVKFEIWLMGKVDPQSGKMVSTVERAIWGPIDGEAEHGT